MQFKYQDNIINKLKVKGWKEWNYANTSQRKTRLATLKSNKINFRPKHITRDQEGHFIKGSIHQEEISLKHYEPNNSASKYMKLKLIELHKEIDDSIIIVRDFNIPLSIIARPCMQKISMDIEILNNTINYLTWLTFIEHPTIAEYIHIFLKCTENYFGSQTQ